MPKATHFKCAGCGRTFSTDIEVNVGKKKYCPDCGNPIKEDTKSYKDLTDYIWFNLGVKELQDFRMPMLMTFVKQIKERYGIGNRQILFTLKYMYEYEEDDTPPPFVNENCIYNIIRYYQKAKEFWSSLKQIKTNQEKIEEALSLPQRKVTISRSALNSIYDEAEQKRKSLYH